MTPPRDTEALIDRLAGELVPVARLRPPLQRGLRTFASIALAGALAIALFAHPAVLEDRLTPALWVELAGTLATGAGALLAAFHLSLPDGRRAWAAAPLPGLALWLAGSGAGCYRSFLETGEAGWRLGESGRCLAFILALGLPLTAVLLLVLRRARPLHPVPVAAAGALAAASFAAFALQFFHPFDVTLMDLLVHATAVGVVVAAAAWRGRAVLA